MNWKLMKPYVVYNLIPSFFVGSDHIFINFYIIFNLMMINIYNIHLNCHRKEKSSEIK